MRFYTVNKIAGLILIAFFIISRYYEFPTYLSSILAFCWFLYVPYALGFLILEILKRPIRKLSSSITLVGIIAYILNWFLGILSISAIAYSLFILGIHIIDLIGPSLLIISVGAILVLESSNTLQLFKKFHLRIILISLVGISFGLYIRSFSPYPLSPGIDVFNHMYVIQSILDNSPSNSPLVYFPTFDIILALGSSTFYSDLNSLFWMGSIVISMFFSLSCYAMLYYFLRSNAQAIFGTAIALPLTEMGFATNLQFLYPASFLMSIFPIMFFSVDYLWKKLAQQSKIVPVLFTSIFFSVIMLIHIQVGFIVCLALSIYIIFRFYISQKDRLFLIFRLVTVVFSVILLAYCLGLVTFQLKLDFIKSNLFESYHLYTTYTKLNILEDWYTKEVLLASVIGFILLSFYKDKKIVILNFIAIVILLTYFQQISDIHRIMPFERSFIALGAVSTVTLPAIILAQNLSDFFHYSRKKIKMRNVDESHVNNKDEKPRTIGERFSLIFISSKLGLFQTYQRNPGLLYFYVILIFAFLYPVLMVPFDTYIAPYSSQGYDFTNYTFGELFAAEWIKENTPENYKIFSDPSTVIEMRGLSYRPNIEGIGWNVTIANQVGNILLSDNATNAYRNILANYGKDIIIVISPRTSEWLNGKSFFVQEPIMEFDYFRGIEKFFDERYFRMDYHKDDIMVFTLK